MIIYAETKFQLTNSVHLHHHHHHHDGCVDTITITTYTNTSQSLNCLSRSTAPTVEKIKETFFFSLSLSLRFLPVNHHHIATHIIIGCLFLADRQFLSLKRKSKIKTNSFQINNSDDKLASPIKKTLPAFLSETKYSIFYKCHS